MAACMPKILKFDGFIILVHAPHAVHHTTIRRKIYVVNMFVFLLRPVTTTI